MTQNRSNVDQEEITRFGDQAQAWWDDRGEFRALHQINPVRLNYISDRVVLIDRQVLDVGCGGGLLCEALAVQGANVTGIDMSDQSLAVARTHANVNNLSIVYRQSTAEAWTVEHSEVYDVITCMELIEHVPDPASLVGACAKLVHSGGSIFFSTVNRTWLARLLVIDVSEKILGIVPRGTHQYRRLIRPGELREWAAGARLKDVDLSGLRFLPYIGYAGLCKDTRLNYMMHFVKE